MGEQGCWAAIGSMCSLMPDENSPSMKEYRARLEGAASESVNARPAPPGSLLLLGYLALRVPDEAKARAFYMSGLGFRRSPREETGREVRVNGGFSQFRLPFRADASGQPHGEAQRWPGTISIWVKDCREVMEALRKFGGAGRDGLIKEVAVPTAGLYKLVLKDIFGANLFNVEEAPLHLVENLGSLTADAFDGHAQQSCSICLEEFQEGDQRRALPCHHAFHVECIRSWLEQTPECPMCKASVEEVDVLESNVLAIMDACYRVRAPGVVSAVARFYRNYLACAADEQPARRDTRSQCVVHLSPGAGLHQTLRFEEDPDAPASDDAGEICVYAASASSFRLSYLRCEKDGLVVRPHSWELAESCSEFSVSGCFDPDTRRQVVPLRHVIRSPMHPECPARPELRSGDAAYQGA